MLTNLCRRVARCGADARHRGGDGGGPGLRPLGREKEEEREEEEVPQPERPEAEQQHVPVQTREEGLQQVRWDAGKVWGGGAEVT